MIVDNSLGRGDKKIRVKCKIHFKDQPKNLGKSRGKCVSFYVVKLYEGWKDGGGDGAKLHLHSLLHSALGGGEWSTSSPGRLTPGKEQRWVSPAQNGIPDRPAHSLATIPTTLSRSIHTKIYHKNMA